VFSRGQWDGREQHHVRHHRLGADAEDYEIQGGWRSRSSRNNCWIAIDLEAPAGGLDERYASGVDPYTTEWPGLIYPGQLAGQVRGF
jgi:hypothetical protein